MAADGAGDGAGELAGPLRPVSALSAQVAAGLIGHEALVERLMVALLAGGHVLIEAPVLKDFIVRLVVVTREAAGGPLEGLIEHAVSPRGTLSLAASARARAALKGRDHALPEDVEALAADALSHRLIPSWRAVSEGLTARALIDRLLSHVRPW